VKLQTFVLSAVTASVFGSVFAYWVTFINPRSVFGGDITDQMVVMVLLGGLGSLWGPAIGGVGLFVVNRLIWMNWGDTAFYIAILGAAIILVVLFLPNGIAGLFARRAAGSATVLDKRSERRSQQGRPVEQHRNAGPGAGGRAGRRSDPDRARLYRHFGGIKAANGVNLEVGRREIAGLIGPNGAGKSTLFSLVAGTVRPDRGQIRFDGHEIAGLSAHTIARMGLARTFQIPALFDNMTVTENLLAAAAQGHWQGAHERAADTLALLKLEPVAGNRASDLSGGQQKLLEFGRVVMRQASLILLDEVRQA